GQRGKRAAAADWPAATTAVLLVLPGVPGGPAADGILELPNSFPQALAQFRQLSGAENEQDDQQYEENVGRLEQASDHISPPAIIASHGHFLRFEQSAQKVAPIKRPPSPGVD